MPKAVSVAIVMLLLAKGLVCAGQNRDASSELLLDNIQEALGAIKTLEADFIQTRHLAVFEDELKSEGKIYFVKPDQLRWQTKIPYPSVFIFNQGKVAKFEIEKGQRRKMKLAGSHLFSEIMAQMINIIKGNFEAIENEYNIEAKTNNNHIEVKLLPHAKTPANTLSSITLTIHPEKFKVQKLRIQEGSEDSLEIAFTKEKVNQELSPSLFSLKSPSEFDIEISK